MQSNTTPYERQQFEMQQVREQIAMLKQQLAELEIECQMNEMTIDNVTTVDEEARAKIENLNCVLQMFHADLAARERVFAQSLIELTW